MIKIYTVSFLLFISIFSSQLFSQNAGDNVFSGTQVHSVRFQFNQPNYWDSLTYYYNQGNEQYIVAAVTINGEVIDSVGVRLKGNSSYSHPNNKKSIRVSFDEYRDDQRWDGLKGIHLNNCWGDPSFIREKMHLDFCRDAGIPAPRANYAEVYINNQLWAFYSLVEHVDKKFLDSRYGNDEGNQFKAVDAFGSSIISDFRWYGSTPGTYYNRYELKTDGSTTAWDDLIRTLDTLNNSANTQTSLPTQVNLSRLYKAIAADNLFANLDSYIGGGRNFYFYYLPPENKMEWIVWDVGLSFGAYSGGVSSLETLSLTYVSSSTNRPLFSKILNTPALRTEYLSTLCYLFNGYFSPARLHPKVDSIANIIRPYVYADPKKMYTNAQFETNLVSDVNAGGGGGTRKPGIKNFITARTNSVQSQLTSLGISCNLAVLPGDVVINEFLAQNTLIPDPSGEFDDWIELYNNTNAEINLSGMYLSDDATQPTLWQFPDSTTIAPNGYLIVWADEDSGQTGLHANFKLSADGEHIRFSNIDVSVLDTITFGAQSTNLSMMRIPNGTGNFVQGAPTFNSVNTLSTLPSITSVILPQFIQGYSGTNNSRIPFAFRARLDNLLPNTTYRYINQIIISTDGPTTNGAANVIYVNSDNTFTRSSGPSFTTAGNYGEFTTNAAGSFTGWFISEATGNARFTPGNYVFMRLRLNDGAGGTTAATYLTTADSVKVIDFEILNESNYGTGIYGRSFADSKDFVFLYDNIDGTGRPVSGTLIENDGVDLSSVTSFVQFYRDSVDNINGSWGTIIPNQLTSGIRRIERRLLSDGSIHPSIATDADGIWPSGANTVNPLGGLSPIRIENYEAPLPVELISFTGSVTGKQVTLLWSTALESNNMGFEIERKIQNQHTSSGNFEFEKIGYVNGNGTTTSQQNYSFTDNETVNGKYMYRLKQLDFSGTFNYSDIIEVEVNVPGEFSLSQNYPNPFNPSTTIRFSIPESMNVSLKVYNVLGQEIKTLISGFKEAGEHTIIFDAGDLISGLYFYKLEAGILSQVKKMMLLK
ncbi:MAG: CotH kinase family protein [Ignavibacteriales bacterium]|nr:MAG: CotH kinase family protein [Ignavibacteriales bacterium]